MAAVLLLASAVAGSILTNKFGFTIPRCNNVFTAAWLIFVGMVVRQKIDVKFDSWFWFVVALISFYSFGVLRGGVSLNGNNFDDIISLTASTVSALYVVCFMSKKITGRLSYLLSEIGRGSFWIMGLHFLGFKLCTVVLNAIGFSQNPALLTPDCGHNVLLLLYYLAGGVLLPLLLVASLRRIFRKAAN